MSLEVIGQKLKSAREAQGLSLRQIYERTKIPINHLQALDLGQPDDLPEPVYVAGFIKRYAECIGLDGQVLADEYKRADAPSNGNAKHAGQPVYVTHDYLKHARIDNRAPSYKLWPFYIGAAIVLMVVLSWYSSQMSNNNQQDASAPSLKESLAKMEPTAASHASNPAAGQTGVAAIPTGTAGANGITLSASRHVWVEVKRLSSGETLFTGNMEAGQQRAFDDAQGLRVIAGNGGSLSVESKGKIEPFGQVGKRSERVFGATAPASAAATQDSSTPTTSASATASATSTANATKPKKTPPKPDATAKTAHRWHTDDNGTRSIPGEDGTRSIDVPYRYSEGRLDAN